MLQHISVVVNGTLNAVPLPPPCRPCRSRRRVGVLVAATCMYAPKSLPRLALPSPALPLGALLVVTAAKLCIVVIVIDLSGEYVGTWKYRHGGCLALVAPVRLSSLLEAEA